MKRSIRHAASGFVLALAGCALVAPTRPAGHVILDREHAITSNYWQPSEDDVRILEGKLARLIGTCDPRVTGMERSELAEYGMRYYGTVVHGRRMIVGKGVHLSQQGFDDLLRENSRPGQIRLEPFGGGSLFFTVVYDVGAERIVSVESNTPL